MNGPTKSFTSQCEIFYCRQYGTLRKLPNSPNYLQVVLQITTARCSDILFQLEPVVGITIMTKPLVLGSRPWPMIVGHTSWPV